ncbi:MAG: patatin-like phospholipase family protein [Microbacteriaceae bacterium]
MVLGGGGSTGNAWLIGVIAGLADVGLDVTGADVIIGTSAGATAAAQVTSAPPAELLAAILSETVQHRAGPRGPAGGRPAPGTVLDQMARTSRIIADSADAADLRRRLGAAALDLDAASDGEWSARWRAMVASRLPDRHWPERTMLITAVDARTGAAVAFDRHSGVELVDAVAAGTSSGVPYRIGDDRYLDGGYRRNENADLAAGCDRVIVLSPFGGKSRYPLEWGMHLATQVDELRADGSSVEAILPDRAAEHLFGVNAMDPTLRPPAARAGYDQGRNLGERLTAFWHPH